MFEALLAGAYAGETTVLAVQEVLHQRARRTGDRAEANGFARDLARVCVLHDVTAADLRLALRLHADADGLDAADALHAATALNAGIDLLVSPDTAFDDVAGLTRLDPAEAAARLPA